ncbi:hypothetical protein VPH35_126316 [Triticum aestivum]
MAGAGEDEAAPPPSSPDRQQPMEEAAAAKRSRSENHHGVADGPSFRMEDLPAEVQPVIISLLPLKEAVRTSMVSTSWRMLWTFHSDLCFHGPDDSKFYTANQHSAQIKRAKFIETVNLVIQQHSGLGINKFSITCGMHKEYADHLDRWIQFAASSMATIIDFNLKKVYLPLKFHHFPLEALEGQGLLAKCSRLEDLEIMCCNGVDDLIIPHKLDKLQHLLIAGMDIQMVEFHATDLAHFEYIGRVIPIVLHGCSKLEKATMKFNGTKALAHAFTAVPGILPVKTLHLQSFISEYAQVIWSFLFLFTS